MKRYLVGAGCLLFASLFGLPANADYASATAPLQHQDVLKGNLADFDLVASRGDDNSTFRNTEVTKSVIGGQNVGSPFMRVYSMSLPPIGYVRFCERNPADCMEKVGSSERVELTEARWAELVSVNRFVNQEIYPVTDEELYGRVEFWTYPNGKGDCEDYVLMKRRILLERGWPMGSLLITVVLDEEGAGHAILTARTTGGDFILDNKREDVLAWSDTPYRFLKRQSYRNPQIWMSLYPAVDTAPVAAFSSESAEPK